MEGMWTCCNTARHLGPCSEHLLGLRMHLNKGACLHVCVCVVNSQRQATVGKASNMFAEKRPHCVAVLGCTQKMWAQRALAMKMHSHALAQVFS